MGVIEYLIGLPVVSGLVMLALGKEEEYWRKWGLWCSVLTIIGVEIVWLGYNGEVGGDQYGGGWSGGGIDSLGILMLGLTALLSGIGILSVWNVKSSVKLMSLVLISSGLLIGAYTTRSLVWYFVYFEGVLIPLYVIIGNWGSRKRKIRAGYYMLVYTLGGSIWMLLSILGVYSETGSVEYNVLREVLIDEERQRWLALGLVIGCGVKIPLLGVHLWLPEAHVEAPTVGSLLLAGIILKLGSYGLIRYVIGLYPVGVEFVKPGMYTIGVIGVIYSGLTALRQTDMKRIIAYGSVGHMSIIVMGIFSGTEEGYGGSVVQQISHGLVSGGLFLCVGMLYERGGSRRVKDYSGVVKTMPVYGVILLVLILGNIGLPGTSSFVGEFMILAGLFEVNKIASVLGGTSMVIGGGYSLWLYNRIGFGNTGREVSGYSDLSRREVSVVLPLVLLTIGIGINPSIVLGLL